MGLSGKLVTQIDTKCNGDVFYEVLRYKPNDLSIVAPDHIQGCELHEGDWGAVGCIINWTYLIDGKPQALKQVIEAADENKKSIKFRAFGGDMMQIYKSFKTIIHANQKDQNSLVTWTFEYEKMSENILDPVSFVNLAYTITKAMDTLQLQLQLQ